MCKDMGGEILVQSFVVLMGVFLFIRGTATTLFLMLLLLILMVERTCFPIPPFLISFWHLSTGSYAKFLSACKKRASVS